MRDEFGAQNPKSQMLRFHTQTAGVQLTAQQPEVNLVRVAVQALAAVLGGTQSLHTNSFDEAIALPTQKAARLALRTQQVIAYESDVCKTVDPFAGSYVVESLTDELETAILELMGRVEDMGGAVAAIESGFQKGEIERSAYAVAQQIDDGDRTVVGVNRFTVDEEEPLRAAPRRPRDRCGAGAPGWSGCGPSATATRSRRLLAEVKAAATGDANVLVPMKAALRARATGGRGLRRACARSGASTPRPTRSDAVRRIRSGTKVLPRTGRRPADLAPARPESVTVAGRSCRGVGRGAPRR